jgi:hypothetical protein
MHFDSMGVVNQPIQNVKSQSLAAYVLSRYIGWANVFGPRI